MVKLAILVAALLVAASARAECPVGQRPMLSVRLYLGQMEGGKRLTNSVWEKFLAAVVTPRFPEGYTTYDAMGRWRDLETKVIGHEPTKIIEVDAPDTQEFRDKMEEIRKDYGARFHQQAVGIVSMPACGAF